VFCSKPFSRLVNKNVEWNKKSWQSVCHKDTQVNRATIHFRWTLWKMLYYFILSIFPLILCSLFFRHFLLFSQNGLISLFWLGLDRLHLIWRIRPFILYKCVWHFHF
jgi:hypothetical protein